MKTLSEVIIRGYDYSYSVGERGETSKAGRGKHKNMMNADHRGRHWRGTIANALFSIAVLMGILLMTSLFSGLFSSWTFLGFPFVFYMGAQGAFVLMIVLVYRATELQEKTDRRHGASEEI